MRWLLVDLRAPFARHWNGGDAVCTAFFNALPMSFPANRSISPPSSPTILHADFHPLQSNGAAAERWLAEHAAMAPPVRPPAASA